MQTSNFAISGKDPNAVAISIGVPRGWTGRRYVPLAPTREMLKMNEADYGAHYQDILSKLDPEQVFADLGANAVLLCWEGFNTRCHRRWVAEWLEQRLGIVIAELGHERGESIPFEDQKRSDKPKRKWPVREKKVKPAAKEKQLSLE